MADEQMPSSGTATRTQWGETMYEACEDLSRLPEIPCPNCVAKTLRVLFIGLPEIRAASGYLWCDTCLLGLTVCRMGVPEDGEIISHTVPVEDRALSMPDFTIVWE